MVWLVLTLSLWPPASRADVQLEGEGVLGLRNLMERIAYLAQGDQIDAEDLAFILAPGGETSPTLPLDFTLAAATGHFQAEYIKKHIESSGGNVSQAARRLGLHRSNLYRKMRQLGMNVDEES